MAENKKKHSGAYKNPTYPLAPGSTMKKPAEFKWRELASAEQGGTNESEYGASPFILSNFAGKPTKKETAKQRAARMKRAPPEAPAPQPAPPQPPKPKKRVSTMNDRGETPRDVRTFEKEEEEEIAPASSAKAETIADKIRRLGSEPYLTHKTGTIWEITDDEQKNGFGEFDIGCDPKKFKLDPISGYYSIPIVDGAVLRNDPVNPEVEREEEKLLLYFDITPAGKPLGAVASEGRAFSWGIEDNPPGGFTSEGAKELFSPETFMDDVWIPYQTERDRIDEQYSGLPKLSVGVGDTIWSSWTS